MPEKLMKIRDYFTPEKRKKTILVSSVIIIAALTLGWFIVPQKQGIQIVETAKIKRGTVYKVLEATGIIKPEVGAIVQIGSRATGTIKQMLVRVGDPVKPGQVIAVIDDRELTAQRNEAEAALKVAQAELDKVRNVYPLQINEAEANLKSTRAEAEYDKLSASRRKTLVNKRLDAVDSLDSAQQKATTSSGQVAARAATLMRLKSEFEQELAKAEANLIRAQATLSTAKIRLSYSVISSPIEGVVSDVTAQEGETVVTGLSVAHLITVLDPSRLEMWIYVDETDVGQVRQGMDVQFRVDSAPDKVFEGKIDLIFPEPETRDNIIYYRARVMLTPEDSLHLRPEMTTQSKISVLRKDDVLTLPNAALKWMDGEQLIFIKDKNGKTRGLTPELGLSGAEQSELLNDDIPEGTEVAVKIIIPKNASSSAPSPAGRPGGGGSQRR